MRKSLGRCLFAVGILIAGSCAPHATPITLTLGRTQEGTARRVSDAERVKVQRGYGQLPLSFEANQGQTDERVQFLARGDGYSLFLTPTESVLALLGNRNGVLRMTLVGANPTTPAAGLEELPGKSNYFVGRDPKQWRTNVPTYGKVRFAGVYPGVDLVYYGNQRQLEYDFVVAPGADPSVIRLGFVGAERLEIDAQGELTLQTGGGEVRWRKPVVYQEVGGIRQIVDSHYMLRDKEAVGFAVAPFNPDLPLVIDPVLVYSTYLGVSSDAASIAVDSSGSAYVTGSAGSVPTTSGAFMPESLFGRDAYIAKMNPAGSALIYSTYLGGFGNNDVGTSIAVDSGGTAYVTGRTNSFNFPTTLTAYKTTGSGGNWDAFVTKLDSAGSALLYSTYLGGGGEDRGLGVAADSSGYAYVTGQTASANFPTLNALRTTLSGFMDAFVTTLDTNLAGSASLVYSTYLGGSGEEDGSTSANQTGAIAVDGSGYVYVTGSTNSPNFPTANAFQNTLLGGLSPNRNAFVTKIDPRLSGAASLIASTYFGTFGSEIGTGIAVDPSGVYVTGWGFGVPTTAGAFQTSPGGGGDAFVTKLTPDISSLIYSTYVGGSRAELAFGIAVDSSGSAHVAGWGASTNFPILNAVQTSPGGPVGGIDAFVTKLTPDGSGLVYSTYLGGSGNDFALGIATDAWGQAYVTGTTNSINFPLANPFQGFGGSPSSAFVSKISENIPPTAVNDGPYSVSEDSALTVNLQLGVLANDTDTEGDHLTAIQASDPAHGSVMLNADGSFTYTPAANYNGPDSFTYWANDRNNSNVAVVTISILPSPDAPVAFDDAYETAEDTPLSIAFAAGVLANDTDAEGDLLHAVTVSGPSHGTLSLNDNGSFAYTPAAHYSGSDSFTYRTRDAQLDSNVATVTITITAAPPTASRTYVYVNDEGNPNSVSAWVLGSGATPALQLVDGVDTGGSGQSVEGVNGWHTVIVVGPYLYASNPLSNDVAGFSINSATGQLTPVPGSPFPTGGVAHPPPPNFGGTSLGATSDGRYLLVTNSYSADVSVFNIDRTSGALTSVAGSPFAPRWPTPGVKPPVYGVTVTPNGRFAIVRVGSALSVFSMDSTSGSLTEVPASPFRGPALGFFAPGAVTINRDSDRLFFGSQGTNTTAGRRVNVLSIASDGSLAAIPGSPFGPSYALVFPNSVGALLSPDQRHLFVTNQQEDTISVFEVSDGSVTPKGSLAEIPGSPFSSGASVVERVTLGGTLDPPIYTSLPIHMTTDPTGSFLITSHKTALTVHRIGLEGGLTFVSKLTYVPDGTIMNGGTFFEGNIASFTSIVPNANRPPLANNDSATVRQTNTVSIPVLANDSDPDGDALQFVTHSQPAHGTLDMFVANVLVYTPNAGYLGSDSFTYTIADSAGLQSTATVLITVTEGLAPVQFNVVFEDAGLALGEPACFELLRNSSVVRGPQCINAAQNVIVFNDVPLGSYVAAVSYLLSLPPALPQPQLPNRYVVPAAIPVELTRDGLNAFVTMRPRLRKLVVGATDPNGTGVAMCYRLSPVAAASGAPVQEACTVPVLGLPIATFANVWGGIQYRLEITSHPAGLSPVSGQAFQIVGPFDHTTEVNTATFPLMPAALEIAIAEIIRVIDSIASPSLVGFPRSPFDILGNEIIHVTDRVFSAHLDQPIDPLSPNIALQETIHVVDSLGAITTTIPTDLGVTASTPTPIVTVGSDVTYSVNVSNLGPSNATAVRLNVTLPAGLQYVSDTALGACAWNAGSATCAFNNVAPGSTRAINIVARILSGAASTASFAVSAAPQHDPNPANNTALVTVDARPTVTINQAASQIDPAIAAPINFTVVFSEPVTGFTNTDVSFAGSTVGNTIAATVTGSGATYTVSVGGMTRVGLIAVSIPAAAAIDSGGNPSAASTSTDRTVLYGVSLVAAVVSPSNGGNATVTATGLAGQLSGLLFYRRGSFLFSSTRFTSFVINGPTATLQGFASDGRFFLATIGDGGPGQPDTFRLWIEGIEQTAGGAISSGTAVVSPWAPDTRLKGWVDLHTHPMSNIAFGGKLFHGAPSVGSLMPAMQMPGDPECRFDQRATSINEALSQDGPTRGDPIQSRCGDFARSSLVAAIEAFNGAQVAPVGTGGFPTFSHWPKWNDITHQKMWIDWIRRSWEGGQRVMVALSHNNRTVAEVLDGGGPITGVRNDRASSDLQIEEIKQLVASHSDFMEVARTPDELHAIVEGGRLAVVLGVEIDKIGDFSTSSVPTDLAINGEIDRLFDQGVRYVLPIHFVDNVFGDAAVYQSLYNIVNYRENQTLFTVGCAQLADGIGFRLPALSAILNLFVPPGMPVPFPPPCMQGTTFLGHANTRLANGLGARGEFAIRAMMRRGMIVDLDHMSNRAANRTLAIANAVPGGGYPVTSGHSAVRDRNSALFNAENSRTTAQLARIACLGGMFGLGTDGVAAYRWAGNYERGHNAMRAAFAPNGLCPSAMPLGDGFIGLGTDANSLVKTPPPTMMLSPVDLPRFTDIYNPNNPINAGVAPLTRSTTGDRTWDYNVDGVAHYGMFVDFLRDVRTFNPAGTMPGRQMVDDQMMYGAEYFYRMWLKADTQKTRVP